jgi:hypothetical protein
MFLVPAAHLTAPDEAAAQRTAALAEKVDHLGPVPAGPRRCVPGPVLASTRRWRALGAGAVAAANRPGRAGLSSADPGHAGRQQLEEPLARPAGPPAFGLL